ncbi:pyridoxamine 5'-phosphate oxidase-domain-containing protein [Dipodascopsis tothii]|uniref:pyridoxamine 5'-phosphate oxidase-domain-containing protein n=1 Tax=Dipodascopsis tothii TaxID=44089 RepID=UPI0034CD952D
MFFKFCTALAVGSVVLSHAAALPVPTSRRPTVEEAAFQARDLLHRESTADMNTVYQTGELAGSAIGLMEYYADCSDDGSLTLLMVEIGHSYNNWVDGSPVSFSIREQKPISFSPASEARMSLTGNLSFIEGEDSIVSAEKCFLHRHPDARGWLPGNRIHKTAFMKFDVDYVYWLGGFGNVAYIGEIPIDLYKNATRKSIAPGWPHKPHDEEEFKPPFGRHGQKEFEGPEGDNFFHGPNDFHKPGHMDDHEEVHHGPRGPKGDEPFDQEGHHGPEGRHRPPPSDGPDGPHDPHHGPPPPGRPPHAPPPPHGRSPHDPPPSHGPDGPHGPPHGPDGPQGPPPPDFDGDEPDNCTDSAAFAAKDHSQGRRGYGRGSRGRGSRDSAGPRKGSKQGKTYDGKTPCPTKSSEHDKMESEVFLKACMFNALSSLNLQQLTPDELTSYEHSAYKYCSKLRFSKHHETRSKPQSDERKQFEKNAGSSSERESSFISGVSWSPLSKLKSLF